MSEVHVWESSQIWRREDGAIVEDRQGKHYSSDPNEAFIHVVLLADYTALRAEVERLTKARDEALGMAEEQQREVAKALRIDPTGDSVYLHYQILAVIDAVRTSFPTTGSR